MEVLINPVNQQRQWISAPGERTRESVRNREDPNMKCAFQARKPLSGKNEHLLGTNPETMDLSVVLKGINTFPLLAYSYFRRQIDGSSKNGIIFQYVVFHNLY